MMGWGRFCGLGGYGVSHMWGGSGILSLLGSFVGVLFLLGLLALFAVVTVWLVRRLQVAGATSGVSFSDRPLEIARRRFAAGEISEEQYRRIRRDLES